MKNLRRKMLKNVVKVRILRGGKGRTGEERREERGGERKEEV